MMNLQAVKAAVDQLSSAERAELREYLDEDTVDVSALRPGTMDVDALLDAAREIRAGFSEGEW
jgi:short-subunit dehydrogenase